MSARTFLLRSFMSACSLANAFPISLSTHQLVSESFEQQRSTLSQWRIQPMFLAGRNLAHHRQPEARSRRQCLQKMRFKTDGRENIEAHLVRDVRGRQHRLIHLRQNRRNEIALDATHLPRTLFWQHARGAGGKEGVRIYTFNPSVLSPVERRTVQAFSAFLSATAFMQYRRPLGSGPSGNTCPKWASQVLQTVSTRFKKAGPSKR